MFFSICLGKKNDEVIKFLGILKKYISENKIYFCSRKKSNVSLNEKVIFVFHTIFKLDFITQIIYCIMSDACVSTANKYYSSAAHHEQKNEKKKKSQIKFQRSQ